MNLEVETKLSVELNFQLPKQALADLGPTINIEPVKRTSTVYFDSSNFDLLSCGVALRFRCHLEDQSPLRKGIWAVKFSTPQRSSVVSRYEYELTGSYASIPREFERVLNVFARQLSVKPIAALEAERTTVTFNRPSGSKLFQVDDDVVTVHSGVGGELKFREIEVELADPASDHEANRAVSLLKDYGAELSRNSSKLELALLQDMSPEQLKSTISRHGVDAVGQMTKAACFVLGQYKSLSQVAEALSALLVEQSFSGWRVKLVDLLIIELYKQPKLDRFALPALLDRVSNALYLYCEWLRVDGSQNRPRELVSEGEFSIHLKPFLELEVKAQSGAVSRIAFASALEDLLNEAFTVSEIGD